MRTVARAETYPAVAVTTGAVAVAAVVYTGLLVAGGLVHREVAPGHPGLGERKVVRLADCCQNFGDLCERRATALRSKLLPNIRMNDVKMSSVTFPTPKKIPAVA